MGDYAESCPLFDPEQGAVGEWVCHFMVLLASTDIVSSYPHLRTGLCNFYSFLYLSHILAANLNLKLFLV